MNQCQIQQRSPKLAHQFLRDDNRLKSSDRNVAHMSRTHSLSIDCASFQSSDQKKERIKSYILFIHDFGLSRNSDQPFVKANSKRQSYLSSTLGPSTTGCRFVSARFCATFRTSIGRLEKSKTAKPTFRRVGCDPSACPQTRCIPFPDSFKLCSML